ncbi:geranylgeranyl pyrophosphate synthase-like [Halichondria panicea]|uniref:geranylgeranyl pyrophosphate synthase-like n=1 Tax=Halichondria panicea TaxID=6063 RepID=UPI00312B9663
MLHNASLCIDDIEDNSKLRRGIPVAHSIFGVAQTINSANYIYFLALEKTMALGHPNAVNIFTTQLLQLHRGQGKDIYWRDCYICPTEAEYMEMVQQKTGGLFKLAVDLMQLFSENKADYSALLDALGLFFQIRDDYANLVSKEYTENKSFCEDLTEGKFSFPIIHGIQHDRDSSKLISILKQRTTDNDIKKYFLQCLEEAGSFAHTKQTLVQLEASALGEIKKLGGNPQLEQIVLKLAELYKPEQTE